MLFVYRLMRLQSQPALEIYVLALCLQSIALKIDCGCFRLKGNVLKYCWRHENKGGSEDLRKAKWYLDKLIEITDDTNRK
jgi:hypothetical protein